MVISIFRKNDFFLVRKSIEILKKINFFMKHPVSTKLIPIPTRIGAEMKEYGIMNNFCLHVKAVK